MPIMEKLYTATVTATDGRNGNVKSDDGNLDLKLQAPKGLGGSDNNFANPEQLFAAGYAACFGSALELAAVRSNKKVGKTSVTAEVTIGKNDSEGFELSVDFAVNVQGVTQEDAEELVEQAHQICPYSNAVRGNVQVEFTITNHD